MKTKTPKPKRFKCKVRMNSKNKQLNVCLPKNKLNKENLPEFVIVEIEKEYVKKSKRKRRLK